MREERQIKGLMRRRDFAYAEVYCHPPLAGPAFDEHGCIKPEIAPEVAAVCKNESNCTVFLDDGTWFTTWSQGSYEHAPDERIVFAVSRDAGQTWSPPTVIVASTEDERAAYGAPFIVPDTQRIYLFFFAGCQGEAALLTPEYGAGNLYFVYSDDRGAHWSPRRRIDLPERDADIFPGRFHGWINHPPQIMPTGGVVLPISSHAAPGPRRRRAWMTIPAEVSVVRCDNILTETDPARLQFPLLPEGPRGIRVDVFEHWRNPALERLLKACDGVAYESAFNFQEMTIIPLSDGRWCGVGRTFLGSPGYAVSSDRGHTWTSVEPLRYAPDGELIKHPMTMCPIARATDGKIVLLFTNNDGSQRGARHVWDGDGRTRNPQWMVVGREIPGETRNAGLLFGQPMILADVDDSGETNLKTGISMPQFFERDGRFFICYNVNKEHILLDEIPATILDRCAPEQDRVEASQ